MRVQMLVLAKPVKPAILVLLTAKLFFIALGLALTNVLLPEMDVGQTRLACALHNTTV